MFCMFADVKIFDEMGKMALDQITVLLIALFSETFFRRVKT